MFTLAIITIMVVGILLGYLVFSRMTNQKPLYINAVAQKAATIVLLFAMGIWLGANDAFWEQARTVGIRGILFAVVTIVCSVAGVYLVSRFAFRKGEK